MVQARLKRSNKFIIIINILIHYIPSDYNYEHNTGDKEVKEKHPVKIFTKVINEYEKEKKKIINKIIKDKNFIVNDIYKRFFIILPFLNEYDILDIKIDKNIKIIIQNEIIAYINQYNKNFFNIDFIKSIWYNNEDELIKLFYDLVNDFKIILNYFDYNDEDYLNDDQIINLYDQIYGDTDMNEIVKKYFNKKELSKNDYLKNSNSFLFDILTYFLDLCMLLLIKNILKDSNLKTLNNYIKEDDIYKNLNIFLIEMKKIKYFIKFFFYILLWILDYKLNYILKNF